MFLLPSSLLIASDDESDDEAEINIPFHFHSNRQKDLGILIYFERENVLNAMREAILNNNFIMHNGQKEYYTTLQGLRSYFPDQAIDPHATVATLDFDTMGNTILFTHFTLSNGEQIRLTTNMFQEN